MQTPTVLLAMGLTCLAPAATWAQSNPPIASGSSPSQRSTGIELEVRTGYGVPAGQAAADPRGALADRFTGVVPLVFGLGYRFHPRVSIGAFFQYGISFINDKPGAWTEGCSNYGFSCSSSVLRWGAGMRVHLLPNRRIDPWLGVGLGYEKMTIDAYAGGPTATPSKNHWTAGGMEFAHLDVGADFRVVGTFFVGAYSTISFARYSSQTVTRPLEGSRTAYSATIDVPDDAVHEWIMFGLRLSYLVTF